MGADRSSPTVGNPVLAINQLALHSLAVGYKALRPGYGIGVQMAWFLRCSIGCNHGVTGVCRAFFTVRFALIARERVRKLLKHTSFRFGP
jgi:hypothetical protein